MPIQTYIVALAAVGTANTSVAAAVTPRTPLAGSSTSRAQAFEPGRGYGPFQDEQTGCI